MPVKPPATASPHLVADRLHSAAIHLLRRLRRVDEASGLSAARLSALAVLVFGGPATPGELAAAERVRPPTMTRLVQGLVRDGLARRTPDARDGRAVRIHATAKGRRILQAGRERRVALLASRLADLPERELELLARASALLETIVRRP